MSWWRTVVVLGIFLGLVVSGLEVVLAGYNQFLLPPDPLRLEQLARAFGDHLQELVELVARYSSDFKW